MAKDKSDNEMKQAELDWIFWGGIVGAVLSMVAGAKIAASWVEGGVLATLLGLIGAILAAPLGLLVGCLLGFLLPQLFALIAFSACFPLLLLHAWLRDWRPRIGSFVASPNPVTAGNSLTLTGSKITVTNRHTTIHKVAFYAYIKFIKTLLGCGTQTSLDVWTLTLTVGLAPGSYTLLAEVWDSNGRSSQPLQLTLTVR
jgi:hypothetical protein